MPNEFNALGRVTGRVKSQASKIQSYLSNLEFDNPQVSEDNFRGVRNITTLNERFTELKRKANSPLEISNLSVQYLSQFITILSNYNTYFSKLENDFLRFQNKIIEIHGNEQARDYEFEDVVLGLIRDLRDQGKLNEIKDIESNVLSRKKALMEAVEDFSDRFADKIYSKYDLDVERRLDVLLVLIPKIAEAVNIVFNQAIEKAKEKLALYREELQTRTAKPKRNQNQEQQPQEAEATDNYLTAARKIKVSVKK